MRMQSKELMNPSGFRVSFITRDEYHLDSHYDNPSDFTNFSYRKSVLSRDVACSSKIRK